ncbi:MAG TPA: DUF397 domain-containing protein [Pseudonocardia sp.]
MEWTKPRRCDNSGPNCVEVAVDPTNGDRLVRNSRRPEIIIRFDQQEWTAFVGSIVEGQQF